MIKIGKIFLMNNNMIGKRNHMKSYEMIQSLQIIQKENKNKLTIKNHNLAIKKIKMMFLLVHIMQSIKSPKQKEIDWMTDLNLKESYFWNQLKMIIKVKKKMKAKKLFKIENNKVKIKQKKSKNKLMSIK